MEVWMGKGAFILREGDGGLLLALEFSFIWFLFIVSRLTMFCWSISLTACPQSAKMETWMEKKRASIILSTFMLCTMTGYHRMAPHYWFWNHTKMFKPPILVTARIGAYSIAFFCPLAYNRWFAWWHHLTHSLFLLLKLIRAIVYWTPLSTSKTVLWEHFQCLYFQKTWAFWIVKL